MTWPTYTAACRRDVDALLKKGGGLSGYRSNKAWGVPPQKWSWAHKFERELESRFGVKHAIAVNSGTMALTAALFSLDLPKGSEIVTTPYSFSATPASILLAGHVPVFADVDQHSFNVTKETVAKVITKKTKAILPVDLFGGLCDYKGLGSFGLPIIRDGCQSVGARVGVDYHFGEVTCASGNGSKNLPLGEGGWCLTDNSKLAERIRLYISHGENFGTEWVGANGRMPELTACVAWHGLQDLEQRNDRRIDLARTLVDSFYKGFFGSKLTGFEYISSHLTGHIAFPARGIGGDHVYYVFPFLVERGRDGFIQRMKRRGLTVGAGYIQPTLNRYPAFRKYQRGPLPVVEELSKRTLCLLYDLTPDKPLSYAVKVARAIRESLS